MRGKEKVCLITGGAFRIGAATAKIACKRGYSVCVNYLSSEEEAEALIAEIKRDEGRAFAYRADVSREDDVSRLFDAIDRTLGPITALVNNACFPGERRPLMALDTALLVRMLNVNVVGPFLCIKEAASRMAHSCGGSGGSIVNISSTVTRTGGYNLSPYVASKAALEGMTTALARELASDGIRVNTVSPGLIDMPQHDLRDSDWYASKIGTIPMNRFGAPSEVADAILWLLSDEASYITGAVIPVSGGR